MSNIYGENRDETTAVGMSKSKYAGSHNSGEDFALRKISECLDKYGISNTSKAVMDLGAGTGNWSVRLADYFDFSKIIAVEPDSNQIKLMKDTFRFNNVSDEKVSIFQSTIQNFNYRMNSTPFIICSHVIQHISDKDVKLVLQKMYHILEKNGILVIFTTHSQWDQNSYLIQHPQRIDSNGNVEEELVTEEVFERSFNDPDCFPTRKYSREYLFNLVKKAGFTILEDFVYHIMNLPPHSEDEVNSSNYKKSQYGMDQILILTKS